MTSHINRSVFVGTLADNPSMLQDGVECDNNRPAFEFFVRLDEHTKVRCVLISEQAREHCLSLHGMTGAELAIIGFFHGDPPYIIVAEVKVQPRDQSILRAVEPPNPS